MQIKSQYEVADGTKQLVRIGSDMMDWSEEYGKIHGLKGVTDNGLRTLNDMSHVGRRLTTVGAAFGASLKSFTQEEQKLIADFINKEVDIERK